MKLSSFVSIVEDANENKIGISIIVKYELRGIIFVYDFELIMLQIYKQVCSSNLENGLTR
jgi:hypothetical protein